MKTLSLIFLHIALLIGCLIGSIGSAKEYAVPIAIQEILCLISLFGFLFFLKRTNNLSLKIYFILVALVALFFIIDGGTRLFFESRLTDFL
jgi:hypothetical protein